MTNMSYCRFQNTLDDLRDCEEALSNGSANDVTGDEARAKRALIALCRDIADNYSADTEADDDDDDDDDDD